MAKEQEHSSIATIHLRGEPYERSVINKYGEAELVNCSASLNILAAQTGYTQKLEESVASARDAELAPLYNGGFYLVDAKLKHGGELTFEESYSLGAFVLMSLNRAVRNAIISQSSVPGYPLYTPGGVVSEQDMRETRLMQATGLLSGMSTKEGYVGLSADEIAGVVAATISLDTVVRTRSKDSVLALGGMGGDRGYGQATKASKLFSLSTLSSAVLAVDGSTHKHHSYPNTSKVAGQSAVEALGARSDFHSSEAYEELLEQTGLMMSSCHNTRTLHTLSHRLRGETINHIIGPLAYTIDADSSINGFIGVNEKVHPATVMRSLMTLSSRGFQKYENSVAFFGTNTLRAHPAMFSESKYYASSEVRSYVAIDEVAPPPYATVASFLRNGKVAGTYELTPEDFFTNDELAHMSIDDLLIPNAVDAILSANSAALGGQDYPKSMYLAMTAGLGIFTRRYLDAEDALDSDSHTVNREYLRAATREALDIIMSGRATRKMEQYIGKTQELAG